MSTKKKTIAASPSPRIFQTFWTAPMIKINKNNVYEHMCIAYVSAKSIKEAGYSLTMYTDTTGALLLKDFAYDEIILKDEEFARANPKMFASSKYAAMKDEPLGSVCVDYDVVIDRDCIDLGGDWDVLTQMKYVESCSYLPTKRFLDKHGWPHAMNLLTLSGHPYCVGVIGFKNSELQKKFLDNYDEAVEMYKNVKIVGNPGEIVCPDYIFEQSYIATLVRDGNYNPGFVVTDEEKYHKLVGEEQFRYYSNPDVGFHHYYGSARYTKEVQELIKSKLTKNDILIINRNYCEYILTK